VAGLSEQQFGWIPRAFSAPFFWLLEEQVALLQQQIFPGS
jgi:hypothetical protein